MIALQLYGINPLGELVLAVVISVLLVALGTYVGVLMALQSFFGESSWEEVTGSERN
ncbi:MAG: hypothetical protein V5A34_02405 [Halapricum sp.]